jgi:hypothetical protein
VKFAEYLQKKRIDARNFYDREPDKFMELKSLFEQMHPDNFSQQKLFLINPLRRKYKLTEQVSQDKPIKKKPLKPKI